VQTAQPRVWLEAGSLPALDRRKPHGHPTKTREMPQRQFQIE